MRILRSTLPKKLKERCTMLPEIEMIFVERKIRGNFQIGQFPVTQELWEVVMGNNPSHFKGDKQRPVESVSQRDIDCFLLKLEEKTGKKYRLPTRKEWEFASEGGIYSQDYKYSGSDRLKQVGWYAENSSDKTHPVGELSPPNELNLCDMSGNVWELCSDGYACGGCYNSQMTNCKSTSFIKTNGQPHNNIGFRLILD